MELTVSIARNEREVRETQRLRYEIFADEMGVPMAEQELGLDRDRWDQFCQHIIVRERETGQAVASTRVLTDIGAAAAGGYYSESEFNLDGFKVHAGRVLEIGRTCVRSGWRNGGTIGMVWSGLVRLIRLQEYSHIIGCASIPAKHSCAGAIATWQALQNRYLADPELRVRPKRPLPTGGADADAEPILPPLVKAYMRLGARFGGPPCWDPAFNCADLFVILRPGDLQARYARHFIHRNEGVVAA